MLFIFNLPYSQKAMETMADHIHLKSKQKEIILLKSTTKEIISLTTTKISTLFLFLLDTSCILLKSEENLFLSIYPQSLVV
jgi:hypothetical protein